MPIASFLLVLALQQDPSPPPAPPFGLPERPLKLDEDYWSFRAAALVRTISGTTRVREWNFVPEKLDLHSHLGIDYVSGVHLEVSRDGPTLRWLIEFEFMLIHGSGAFPGDFNYDEGHFKAGRPYEVDGFAAFLRGSASIKLWKNESSWTGLAVGFEYPFVVIGIDQPGVDQSAETYRQFMPYPMIGFAYECEVAETLSLTVRAMGSYVDGWPTAFIEGGRMYMSVTSLFVEAILTWQATRGMHVFVGVQYQYWDGELRSREDGNQLRFHSPGILLGGEIRW